MPASIIGRQNLGNEIKASLPLKSPEIDLYNQHSIHVSAKTGLLGTKTPLASC